MIYNKSGINDGPHKNDIPITIYKLWIILSYNIGQWWANWSGRLVTIYLEACALKLCLNLF